MSVRAQKGLISVNFINILQATFWDNSVLSTFTLITVLLCNMFWQKNVGKKAAHKMLVNLRQFHQQFMRAFLYESVLRTFSLITVLLCNVLAKEN